MYTPESRRRSAVDFRRAVWPVVARYFGGSTAELISVEGEEASLSARTLDIHARIDALVYEGRAGALTPLTLRISYQPYGTFTMNAHEVAKRLRNYPVGHLRPSYAVQAHVTQPETGRCVYYAIVRDEDLTRALRIRPEIFERHVSNEGQVFYAVWPEDLRDVGIQVEEAVLPGGGVRLKIDGVVWLVDHSAISG